LPDADHNLDPPAKSIDFVRKFQLFYRRIGAPRDLKAWNCSGYEAVTRLTNLTMEQRKENLDLNPVPFARVDVINLLERLCLQCE
jgi:hypothetical protein